jgi:hypothetical protein
MTAAEVYESVTNGSASDFRALVANPEGKPTMVFNSWGLAVDCCLDPIAETYPKLREKIPLEIVEQLK